MGLDTLLGPEETGQVGAAPVGGRSCAVLIVSRKGCGRRLSSFAGSLSCHIGSPGYGWVSGGGVDVIAVCCLRFA
jgi:hypothetical protein